METVTIRRPTTTTDRYGNTVSDWSDPTDTTADALAIYPRSEGDPEINAGRTAVIVGLTVLLPIDTDVAPTDRMVVRSVVYAIEGEPGEYRAPWGWEPGIEVALRRVDG